MNTQPCVYSTLSNIVFIFYKPLQVTSRKLSFPHCAFIWVNNLKCEFCYVTEVMGMPYWKWLWCTRLWLFCACMCEIGTHFAILPEDNEAAATAVAAPSFFPRRWCSYVCESVFVHMCGRDPFLHPQVRAPEMETKSPPAFLRSLHSRHMNYFP